MIDLEVLVCGGVFCDKGGCLHIKKIGRKCVSNGYIVPVMASHSVDRMTHNCSQQTSNSVDRIYFGMPN